MADRCATCGGPAEWKSFRGHDVRYECEAHASGMGQRLPKPPVDVRAIVRGLLDAIEKCHLCDAPSTHGGRIEHDEPGRDYTWVYACDEHKDRCSRNEGEEPHAALVRAALSWLAGQP